MTKCHSAQCCAVLQCTLWDLGPCAIKTLPFTTALCQSRCLPCALQVVNQPKDQLLQIKNSAMTEGNDIKAKITDTVNTFKGTTGGLKQLVVNQVNDIKGKYQEPAKTYDGYRYMPV